MGSWRQEPRFASRRDVQLVQVLSRSKSRHAECPVHLPLYRRWTIWTFTSGQTTPTTTKWLAKQEGPAAAPAPNPKENPNNRQRRERDLAHHRLHGADRLGQHLLLPTREALLRSATPRSAAAGEHHHWPDAHGVRRGDGRRGLRTRHRGGQGADVDRMGAKRRPAEVPMLPAIRPLQGSRSDAGTADLPARREGGCAKTNWPPTIPVSKGRHI